MKISQQPAMVIIDFEAEEVLEALAKIAGVPKNDYKYVCFVAGTNGRTGVSGIRLVKEPRP